MLRTNIKIAYRYKSNQKYIYLLSAIFIVILSDITILDLFLMQEL